MIEESILQSIIGKKEEINESQFLISPTAISLLRTRNSRSDAATIDASNEEQNCRMQKS